LQLAIASRSMVIGLFQQQSFDGIRYQSRNINSIISFRTISWFAVFTVSSFHVENSKVMPTRCVIKYSVNELCWNGLLILFTLWEGQLECGGFTFLIRMLTLIFRDCPRIHVRHKSRMGDILVDISVEHDGDYGEYNAPAFDWLLRVCSCELCYIIIIIIIHTIGVCLGNEELERERERAESPC